MKAGRPSGRTSSHVSRLVNQMNAGKLNVIINKNDLKKFKQFCMDKNKTMSSVVKDFINNCINQ
ncbi:hypothetical protein Bealeia2_01970 (plasmid) [Candidatus Bealeia paramacronuclearis]|nr:hypothetical protein [Candidatus Bealeia paramacronuclearis]